MPRRKARGTLEQRGQRWFLQVRTETVVADTGLILHVRRRVPLGDTTELRSEVAARREADAWLARQQPEQITTGEHVLTADYLERFLSLEAALYRPSTQRFYRSIVRRYLLREIGSLPLARVGTGQIKSLIATLSGRGIHRSTIISARAVLLQALRQAKVDGFDAQAIDPKLVRVPKQSVAEREQRHVSQDELTVILEASEYPWRALWALMGLLGLRISEALGIAWSHLEIDSAQPLASIRQSVNDGVVQPLKTKTSRADLPIPADLAQVLNAYRAVWRPNKAGLLFATRAGKPLRAENIRWRHWNPLLERLQLPPAGFHALRHGLPRRLFAAGCSASVVRLLMRHGSLRMTERYTHATAEDLRAAVEMASQKNKT